MVDIVMIILYFGYMGDNLSIFEQELDEPIRSIYPNINFTMIYDYMEIQFSDLTVYVENGF